MINSINVLLEEDGIKCFILTNSECRHCKEWFDNTFSNIRDDLGDIKFHIIDCYNEQQAGRMFFPPLVAPTFYFYKNKQDFPLILQGILPELELKASFNRAIELLKND